MNDLVSYNAKHNEANGEDNRDGINDNLSWNCGVEGEAHDSSIETLRERQIKNFATLLMLSRGVPMILAGDEIRRTQMGNNNAYCQDNEISWMDWNLVDRNRQVLRFWKRMIEFRKSHTSLRSRYFFRGQLNERGLPDVEWHGCHLNSPGWSDPDARALGMTLAGFHGEEDIHVMMNMHWDMQDFELPSLADRRWFRLVSTADSAPNDIADPGTEKPFDGEIYSVEGRSIVILVSRSRWTPTAVRSHKATSGELRSDR